MLDCHMLFKCAGSAITTICLLKMLKRTMVWFSCHLMRNRCVQ